MSELRGRSLDVSAALDSRSDRLSERLRGDPGPLRVPLAEPTPLLRDTGKLSAWDDYIAGIDLDFQPAADHVVIDNSASSEPLQSQATKMLATIAGAA